MRSICKARVMEIPLTQGKKAIIHAADLKKVAGMRWHAIFNRGWYASTKIMRDGRRVAISMHRFLIDPTGAKQVDHRDGNGLNNRRCNLRKCTIAQNCANAKQKPHSSRYKGVHWRKNRGFWTATIMKAGKAHFLGCFHSEVAAAMAYNSAALSLFGKFARLNVIQGDGA